jgi:hypothetical protein
MCGSPLLYNKPETAKDPAVAPLKTTIDKCAGEDERRLQNLEAYISPIDGYGLKADG